MLPIPSQVVTNVDLALVSKLIPGMQAVWVPVGSSITLQDAPKTDFIVIGPIDKKSHKTAGKLVYNQGNYLYILATPYGFCLLGSYTV